MNGHYGGYPYAYLMAPAGRMFNYTNTGFVLAGLVAETVSGRYYRQGLEEDVFLPLGMRRTFFLPQDVIADSDFALGETGVYLQFYPELPPVIEPGTYDNAWARPAGFAFSSVLDLAEFVKFLRAGHTAVLADDLRRAMQEPQMNTELALDLVHYGYGLMVQEGGFYRLGESDFFKLRTVFHGGDAPGFAADLYYVPELDFGFVCLSNGSMAHLQKSFLTALTSLSTLPAPSAAPDLSMNPAVDYDRYAGDYLDENSVGRVNVRRSGNELRVSLPDLDALVTYSPVLAPGVKHNFLLDVGGYPVAVTFILDALGRSEYFRTRGFVARRDDGAGPRRVDGRGAPLGPRLSRSDLRRLFPEPALPLFARPAASRG